MSVSNDNKSFDYENEEEALGADSTSSDVTAAKRAIAHITIAPGVIETIIAEAAKEVEGVFGVGRQKFGKPISSVLEHDEITGAKISAEEDGQLVVNVDIQVYYGYKLQDLIADVKQNICDSLRQQVGIEVEAVNVYVSALHVNDKD